MTTPLLSEGNEMQDENELDLVNSVRKHIKPNEDLLSNNPQTEDLEQIEDLQENQSTVEREDEQESDVNLGEMEDDDAVDPQNNMTGADNLHLDEERVWKKALDSLQFVVSPDEDPDEILNPPLRMGALMIPLPKQLKSFEDHSDFATRLKKINVHSQWINVCRLLLKQMQRIGPKCEATFAKILACYQNPDITAFKDHLLNNTTEKFHITSIKNPAWKKVGVPSQFTLLRYNYTKMMLSRAHLMLFSRTFKKVSFQDYFSLVTTSTKPDKNRFEWLEEYRMNSDVVGLEMYEKSTVGNAKEEIDDQSQTDRMNWLKLHRISVQQNDGPLQYGYGAALKCTLQNLPELQIDDHLFLPFREFTQPVLINGIENFSALWYKGLTAREQSTVKEGNRPPWIIDSLIGADNDRIEDKTPPGLMNFGKIMSQQVEQGFLMTNQHSKISIRAESRPYQPLATINQSLHCLLGLQLRRSPVLYESHWNSQTSTRRTREFATLKVELQNIFIQQQTQAQFMMDNFFHNKGVLLYETAVNVRDSSSQVQNIDFDYGFEGFLGDRLHLALHLFAMKNYSHARAAWKNEMDACLDLFRKDPEKVRQAMLICCPKGFYRGIDLKA